MDALTTTSPLPQLVGDYEIVRMLGMGNNGRYFLARPPARLGLEAEFVVLKVFASCSERAYELSVRELRMSTAVNSPYLVRVYDAVLNDSFALATEYLPLGTLDTPARPLSRPEVLGALRDGARGAHALHEAGLAHSDIKPANIALGQDGDALIGKLSDLGLARFLNPGATLTGMAPTDALEFVDPALLGGSRPSRLSEVWALGATIHRVLSGSGIYGELQATAPLLAIRRVLSSEPEIDAALAPAEAALVRDCLAKPTERLGTAGTVADRLQELLGNGN